MSARRGLRSKATPEEQERAIINAATREFSDVGVRRANMNHIAEQAGVSRSTLYRRFSDKDELLLAIIRETSEAILENLKETTRGLSPREALVEGVTETFRQVQSDPLLRRLLINEPEVTNSLFGLNMAGLDDVLDSTAIFISRTLIKLGARKPEEELRIVAELLIRLTTSLLNTPSKVIDITSTESVRRFVTKFMAPMIE